MARDRSRSRVTGAASDLAFREACGRVDRARELLDEALDQYLDPTTLRRAAGELIEAAKLREGRRKPKDPK